ncbi:MAG: acyl-CoA-binding protein [Pseudomonadota bacterium]
MSDLQQEFEQASVRVKALDERPDNDTMLKLYALYKQGSEGDISGEKPGFFDFVGVAKYEAWEKQQGVDQATAQQQYIDLVNSLTGEA